MRGQGQLAENGGSRAVDIRFLKPLCRATEPHTQRHVFILLTEFAQELSNFLGAGARFLNLPKRGGNFDLALFDIFQQSAIKRATMFRAVCINPAMTSVKRGARLRKFPLSRRADFIVTLTKRVERQTERLELLAIVAALQLNVRKDHAVAAKSAGETKFFGD